MIKHAETSPDQPAWEGAPITRAEADSETPPPVAFTPDGGIGPKAAAWVMAVCHDNEAMRAQPQVTDTTCATPPAPRRERPSSSEMEPLPNVPWTC
ncbi:MAG: hypothetical protein ACD_28C00069G0002 [uncultured bacterium]|nr:MAG: hypothetical protein ACD_28C00069G0002 [uncultured bacterium]